jgi:hypothetical protein
MANILEMEAQALSELDLTQVGRLTEDEIYHILLQFEETETESYFSNLWNCPKMVELFAKQMVDRFHCLPTRPSITHVMGISLGANKLSKVFATKAKLELIEIIGEDGKLKQLSEDLVDGNKILILEDHFTFNCSRLKEAVGLIKSFPCDISFSFTLYTVFKKRKIDSVDCGGIRIFINALMDL